MIKTYPELPDWVFEIEEVSAGVYQVLARNNVGQQVEEKGIDVIRMIETCREQARNIQLKGSPND